MKEDRLPEKTICQLCGGVGAYFEIINNERARVHCELCINNINKDVDVRRKVNKDIKITTPIC